MCCLITELFYDSIGKIFPTKGFVTARQTGFNTQYGAEPLVWPSLRDYR